MDSISASVCSATETALPPGVFITSTPAAVAAADRRYRRRPRAADDAQFRRFRQHLGVHLHGAADHQRVASARCFDVLLGIGNDNVPIRCALEQFDASRSHRLSNQNVHVVMPLTGSSRDRDCPATIARLPGFALDIGFLHRGDACAELHRVAVGVQE